VKCQPAATGAVTGGRVNGQPSRSARSANARPSTARRSSSPANTHKASSWGRSTITATKPHSVRWASSPSSQAFDAE
jgi:hypothetical protein